MNVRDFHDQDFDGPEPPSADLLAGEYVLGVLDAETRREVHGRIARDPGFARLVVDWEHRLASLIDSGGLADVPPHLWPRIRSRLGWPAVDSSSAPARTRLWQSTAFWRAATGLAAAAALAAIVIGPLGLFRDDALPGPGPGPIAIEPTPPTPAIEDPSAPKPVTTLAHDDGSPGWLASVDPGKGTVLMVPVPAPADAEGRVPELWLIPPGGTAKSLGIVSIDRSHTVKVPETLRDALAKGAVLAITLEPIGGAPQGVATGPIIAKGAIVTL